RALPRPARRRQGGGDRSRAAAVPAEPGREPPRCARVRRRRGPAPVAGRMTVAREAPASGGRARDLRWWREVIYIALVYLAYSAVRNQFGSGAGAAVDPDPAFHHAEAIIHIERSLGLYFEH